MQLYGACGRPPKSGDIAVASGISPEHVATILRTLQSHDLVALDQACERIRLAYPFTETGTGHQVTLNGHALHALCAIDALGVADMYGADVAISSSCNRCAETIHVRTTAKGCSLRSFSPPDAVVWYDFAYDGNTSTSCCPAIAFFCSDEHLQQWIEARTARREGIRLTPQEALEVGRAIFGPVLKR